MIVTLRHVLTVPGFSRRPGFCRSGARAWFAAHGLDWRAFVKDGLPEETLAATGDALALAVIEWARDQEAGDRKQEAEIFAALRAGRGHKTMRISIHLAAAEPPVTSSVSCLPFPDS
jgi:hypothetical protein